MPLPNLEQSVPRFDITIPSTKEVVKFRSFLVKEEKLLLIAVEGNDEQSILDSTLQVISACALSSTLKVETLANFDIEYVFLQLRARSVNEIVELAYKCHNDRQLTNDEIERRFKRTVAATDEPTIGKCENVVKISLNLDTVKVKFDPTHSRQIFLTDTMGVNMRYPSPKLAKQIKNKSEGIAGAIQNLAMSIESVFDDQSVYTNFQPKEMEEWVEMLTQPQFMKIERFFETMPVLTHDIQFHCPKCGYKETIRLEGLESFFG